MTAKKRPRARRGTGTVFYDASRKRWIGQLTGGKDPDTGQRKRGPKVSDLTEQGAWDKLDQLRQDQRVTGVAARRDITVETIVRDLLATPPATWRSPITIQVYTDQAERIIGEIGKRRLAELQPRDVRRFLAGMVREGLSTSTISSTKGVLVRAIHRAVQDGLVGRNVAQLAETPAGTRKESRAMDLTQIRALFALDLTAWLRAYLMTGMGCGLRPGELLGLTWDDVDFAAGLIRVRHCLKAVPGPDGRRSLQLASLKTERSKRTLMLPARVAEALRALSAAQAKDKLRLGGHYTDQGLVFAGNAGQACGRQEVERAFKSVCEQAGIGRNWHPHELRHTFVSVLSEHGVDLEDIADAAGHKNSTITGTVYRHQISDKITRATAAMDDILGKVIGS